MTFRHQKSASRNEVQVYEVDCGKGLEIYSRTKHGKVVDFLYRFTGTTFSGTRKDWLWVTYFSSDSN